MVDGKLVTLRDFPEILRREAATEVYEVTAGEYHFLAVDPDNSRDMKKLSLSRIEFTRAS
jgi:hypothetical protein